MMEFATLDANLDDREEGEIVDDDFEDISDNSIIVPIFSGKSVSPNEHLPAISLSSVTEVDEPKSEIKTRHRHKIPRKKSTKIKKRRNSYRKSTCSDSDSDDYLELDRKLQEQLKAAIRVDDTEERHKNSLRSRLKGMTKLDESDSGVEKNDNEEKLQDKNSSDEADNELAQLRLEALRTAVLNKFMHRKKRKVKETKDNDILSDTSIKTDNSETNKENNQNAMENCAKKVCLDNPVQNGEKKMEIATNIVAESITPPEEDEDVLRALLLASMSKKITSETERKRTIVPITNSGLKKTVIIEKKKETMNIMINKVTNFKNRTSKNNMANKKLDLPEVKPLIINVNEDSDSEDDLFNKTVKNSNDKVVATKQRTDVEIQNSVEKFLKEQRAKVEAQLSPIPKSPVKPKNSSVPLDKSSLKLLPKVKQMEYQTLLLKIKNAERKPRLRRVSQRLNAEGKPVVNTSKRIVKIKTPVAKQVTPVPKVDPALDVKTQIRNLQKIFKEIQVQKNGRLQIQEKYKVLRPVIKKINEASVERRKCEGEVKRLLEEIADMKKKLVKAQEDFAARVNSLVQEKERVDKSANLKGCDLVANSKARFTSTPIKENPPVNFETSSILITIPNSTPPLSEKVAEPTIESKKVEDVLDAPLNPGDPNDIDIIYSKQKNTFPKYISPLDSVKRVVVDDPFSIVCPYDVDGNCRDPECIYKHFLK